MMLCNIVLTNTYFISTVTVSTRNYLRGLIEKSIESLHKIANSTPSIAGRIDFARYLLNQKIGQSGFIYCIDREGKLVVGPDRFKDPNQYSRLPIQITRKDGYFEYSEKDYKHHVSRPKADYSKFFKPWGWTIVASAYRDEFDQLVQIADLKYIVLSYQIGNTGYSYILETYTPFYK